jgi:hypothetical protein
VIDGAKLMPYAKRTTGSRFGALSMIVSSGSSQGSAVSASATVEVDRVSAFIMSRNHRRSTSYALMSKVLPAAWCCDFIWRIRSLKFPLLSRRLLSVEYWVLDPAVDEGVPKVPMLRASSARSDVMVVEGDGVGNRCGLGATPDEVEDSFRTRSLVGTDAADWLSYELSSNL